MAIKDRLVNDVLFQKMEPLGIAKYWSVVQQTLLESLAGQKATEGYHIRLMGAVQDGSIQVWSALARQDSNPVLIGMIFTIISHERLLGTKTLWIYGLSLHDKATPEVYAFCLATLQEYAKKEGCHDIRALTEKHGVAKMLKSNGWQNGACLLTKEI